MASPPPASLSQGPVPRDANGRFGGIVIKEMEPAALQSMRRPQYEFGNAQSTETLDETCAVYMSPNDWAEMGHGWVRWEQRYRGVFFENMCSPPPLHPCTCPSSCPSV